MSPATTDFVVVDVETSGFDATCHRVLSVAALTLAADGSPARVLHTLLDPGVDPGPTNIHGLTPAMLAGQPHYRDIAPTLNELLAGRILVAHNPAFDHAFLAAEAARAEAQDVSSMIQAYLPMMEMALQQELGTGAAASDELEF